MPTKLPDIALLDAMCTAAEQLRRLRIPFALAGGLALRAHGHAHSAQHVEFLMGDEAFHHHAAGLISIAPGVPIRVGDVPVDPISIEPPDAHLHAAIQSAVDAGGIPVLPLEALVYMKLKSPRRQDAADIVSVLQVTRDPAPVRAYIQTHAPALLPKYDELAAEAAT